MATAPMERLSLDTLEDDSGHRLTDEFVDAVARVNNHIQEHMDQNGGDVPDKPYKVTVEVEIEASGVFSRAITWNVAVKYPATGRKHSQFASSRDGVIVTQQPAGQERLPLGATAPEQWEGEKEE